MQRLYKLLSLALLSCVVLCFGQTEEKVWYSDTFDREFVTANGKKVPASALQGKMVGVYFSASWCGPCRKFTPKLVRFYNQVAIKNKLEIVFVSCDRREQDMMQYMKKDAMPWLAIPFNDPARQAIQSKLQVSSIPTFIVYDSQGKIITREARYDVANLGVKAIDAWKAADRSTPKKKEKNVSNWLSGPSKQWYTRMDTALKAAQKKHKKIFVLSTGSDWCGYCKKLYKEVLTSPEFGKLANDKMILVYLDFPHGKMMPKEQQEYNRSLVRALSGGNGGYPTAFVLDAKGNALGKISGYRAKAEYIPAVKKLLAKEKSKGGLPDWAKKSPEEINESEPKN